MLNSQAPRHRAPAHALLCATAMACSLAQAQDPAAARPQLSTRAEYLGCLLANDDLMRDGAQLDADQQRQQKRLAALQAASLDLAAQMRRHAPQNKAEADSYNRAVASHNASVSTVNAQGQVLRQRQDDLNRRIYDYNGRCGAMIVSQEDRAAAEADHRQRRLARAAASAAAD